MQALKRGNSRLAVDTITVAVTAENALSLLAPYDIILDCTDNAPTRYLLSDTAVTLGKPLVSGAAQKYDGQLCTYNLGPDGPCYRCLFPSPPPRESMASCEETGVLGAVTGIIGNMQALEAIKIITGLHDGKPSLLLFSALGSPCFRSIKLRSRKPSCTACGSKAYDRSIMLGTDYIQFCGGVHPDWEQQGLTIGDASHRINVNDFKGILNSGRPINLLDVRPKTEFGICQLPSSINIPLKQFLMNPKEYLPSDPQIETYIVCRLGNDSQIAAETLRRVEGVGAVKDIIGGLKAWSRHVDTAFPIY
ncbi:hypothetical protein BDQ12DRAFT_680344 [Crucibulum laeve]|uniref:Rhodanese domain-containing protein n=1 Tax=Crucibulum laeve TaxID=68775 RepID=A0A5C3M5D1_9AGAR|nr:hypothetical protein BDQ12DRAFT_680344 [Crucibulum laeve]